MQIKCPILFIVYFILVMNALTAFAGSHDQEVDHFNQRYTLFEKVCITQEGSLNSLIADSKGNQLDCQSEAHALKEEESRLRGIIETDSSPAQEATCNSKILPDSDPIASLSKDGLDAASAMSCTKKEEQMEEVSCLKQAGCNALRSFMNFVALEKQEAKIPIDKKDQYNCLGNNQSDCLTEVVAGVLKSLWTNVEAVWDLVKMGAGWAKDKVVSGWKAFTDVEDKTSDSAMAASLQSESWIKTFMESPGSALKKMGEDLYNLVAQGIKDSFMCAKWEGVPHVSKCLAPQTEAWECATCDQKMNSICGVVGFAGGEIVTAYLTGGVLSLGKAAVKSGVGTASINSKLSMTLPKFKKSTKLKVAKIKMKSTAALDKALKNKAVTAMTGAVKLVAWPLTQYMKLMDKALALGMKHGEYRPVKLKGNKNAKSLDDATDLGVKENPTPAFTAADHDLLVMPYERKQSGLDMTPKSQRELTNLGRTLKEQSEELKFAVKDKTKFQEAYFKNLLTAQEKLEAEGFIVEITTLPYKDPITKQWIQRDLLKIISGPGRGDAFYKPLSGTLAGAQRTMGVDFYYDPLLSLRGTRGAYEQKNIFLSMENFSGTKTELNTTILHEVRHAHIERQFEQGKPGFYYVRTESEAGEISVDGYKKFMSHEELSTNMKQLAQSRMVKKSTKNGALVDRTDNIVKSLHKDSAYEEYIRLTKRTRQIAREIRKQAQDARKIVHEHPGSVEFRADMPAVAVIKVEGKEMHVSLLGAEKMKPTEKIVALKKYLEEIEANIAEQLKQVRKWDIENLVLIKKRD